MARTSSRTSSFSIRSERPPRSCASQFSLGGLRHPGDSAMSRHVYQAAIEEEASQCHDHRGKFPVDHQLAFTSPISSATSIARTNEAGTLTLLFSKFTKVIPTIP